MSLLSEQRVLDLADEVDTLKESLKLCSYHLLFAVNKIEEQQTEMTIGATKAQLCKNEYEKGTEAAKTILEDFESRGIKISNLKSLNSKLIKENIGINKANLALISENRNLKIRTKKAEEAARNLKAVVSIFVKGEY